MPYMILIITPSMKDWYMKYGQSMSFDTIPKLKQMRRSRFYTKFWFNSTFGGLDSNNRFVLFGLAMIVHNQCVYYKKPEVIYDLFTEFFRVMQVIKVQTIITSDGRYYEEGLSLLKNDYKYEWIHLIGWSYKLRSLMNQMRSSGYKNQQIKHLINQYSLLLKENDIQMFYEIVQKILELSKEKKIIYNFLGQIFPNKYCGFGFTISRMETYSKMCHFFLHKHNFYRHFQCLIDYEQVLLKASRKVALSTRSRFLTLQDQVRKLTVDLEKSFGLFRKPEPYKTECLESIIFRKIIDNFNRQRDLKVNKINQNMYALFRNDVQIQKISYFSSDKKWHCSCMYQMKIGIPCPHLIKIFSFQKVNTREYFDPRWLRWQDKPKSGPQRLSRKKRRHD